MALRFIDGFDHVLFADVGQKWTSFVSNVTGPAMSSAITRFGVGQSYQSGSNSGTTQAFHKTLDAQGTWIVGFGLRFTAFPANLTDFVQFNDGAGNQVSFRFTTGGLVAAYRNGTLLGTSATGLTPGTWQFFEFKVVISATVGVASCRVNGVSILNLTSQNTKAQTNATALTVVIGNGSASLILANAFNLDDVYICDGTGATNNDFLGDVRVQTLYPTGAGATSAWASSSGGANYLNVDEAQGNGDTDYNSSATVGATDTYTYTDIPATNTVVGVQVNAISRKDDAGVRTLAPVVRHGATDYAGTAQPLGAGSYLNLMQVYEQNPGTAAAWVATDLNNAEFGVKIAS